MTTSRSTITKIEATLYGDNVIPEDSYDAYKIPFRVGQVVFMDGFDTLEDEIHQYGDHDDFRSEVGLEIEVKTTITNW